MYNTRYLPENSQQWRPEKTILQHILYNLNVCYRWITLIQDGSKKPMKGLVTYLTHHLSTFEKIEYASIYSVLFNLLGLVQQSYEGNLSSASNPT